MLGWLIGSDIGRLLAGAVAALVAFAGVFLSGRSSGKKAEQNKALKKRVDDMEKAKEVRDEVDALGDGDMRDRLDGWMRDND